jgi:DNA-directed RNA polymerase beta subunit
MSAQYDLSEIDAILKEAEGEPQRNYEEFLAESDDASALAREQPDSIGIILGQASPAAQKAAKEPAVAESPEVIDAGLNVTNLITLPFAELMQNGMVGHHISSMNTFLSEGIEQIVKNLFELSIFIENKRDNLPEDRAIKYINLHVKFTDVEVCSPRKYDDKTGQPQRMTPNMAILEKATLSNPLRIGMKITAVATPHEGENIERIVDIKDLYVGDILTLTRSEGCLTSLLNKDALRAAQEDPRDPGGIFIIYGGEWGINTLENITNNWPHIHKTTWKNEVCRVDFISKPGDSFENSARSLVRLYNNGSITVELTTGKFDKLEIPFYIMYRALGMTSDEDIANSIVFGGAYDERVLSAIREILRKSFIVPDNTFESIKHSTIPTEIVQFLATCLIKAANPTAAHKEDEILKYFNANILDMIDKWFFPHIGLAAKDRIKKLKYFGYIINKMLLVHLGVLEPTNRDDYDAKRVFPAGTSFAKIFKQGFNFAVVGPMKQGLTKAFRNSPFSDVDIREVVRLSLNTEELLDLLTRSVVTGTGSGTITIKRREIKNNISSQQIIRKNDLCVYSVLRSFNTQNMSVSKQTDRAEEMRTVQSSHPPYVDCTMSPETIQVGMIKQMGISTSISGSCQSSILKEKLHNDPDVIPYDSVTPADIYGKKLGVIFVGADPVGYCTNTALIRDKYIAMRRRNEINRRITVAWSSTSLEIHFWTDVGRPLVPLVIVYNNIEEYRRNRREGRPAVFRQWIKLTAKHIYDLQRKKITNQTLEEQGVIEYIAPSELRNAYVALNIDVLRAAAGDVCNRFTHMGIEQQMLGIVSLCSPFNNHASATRNTYFTCQRKSAISWPALNYPFRMSKLEAMQHVIERPLISTMGDMLTLPAGHVVTCAIMIGNGNTQEDSLGLNKNSCLFNVSLYSCENVELDKNEILGNPDPLRTLEAKKSACYDNLEDGKYIKVGSRITNGQILVRKVIKTSPAKSAEKGRASEYIYRDRSTVFRKEGDVYVENVVTIPNNIHPTKILIRTRENRKPGAGDKLYSRHGNKGIIADVSPRCDMPYTADGLIPDIITSIHSIPTRMAINQQMEMRIGQEAARRGCFIDSTVFKPAPNLDDMAQVNEEAIKSLEDQVGGSYAGARRFYNGKTGRWFDALLFAGPCVYIRHNKFIDDNMHVIYTGPTNSQTKQPLDGKSNQGGIKLGEMEKNAIIGHGTMTMMFDKLYKNSDGCEIYVCAVCGKYAIVNKRQEIYRCKTCEDAADIRVVPYSWSTALMRNEISAMNVGMSLGLEPHAFPMGDIPQTPLREGR